MSAAALLFIDDQGRVLLVQRSWKPEAGLVLPGGVIEPGESPQVAVVRKVKEELGIFRSCGPLLVHDRRPGMDHYIFDGGPAPTEASMAPDYEGEVGQIHWLRPDNAIASHSARGQLRLHAALAAREASSSTVIE